MNRASDYRLGWMQVVRDAVGFAFDALRVNRVRTGLTVLGMVIGTSSVILVATIALTSRDYVLGQIEGVGSNLIYAYHESGPSGTATSPVSDALTLDDLRAIRENVPYLRAASAVIEGRASLLLENREREVTLLGASPEYRIVRNLRVLAGRFFDQQDDQQRSKVCLVTENLAEVLFPGGWSEERKIKVRSLEFTVIGVFRESAETYGQAEIAAETVMLPVSVMAILTGSTAVDQIYASATEASRVPEATAAILEVIRRRHRPGAVYRAENLTEILAAAGNIALALTLVLLLISAIALLISGIGIMNIMLVTVTERTREIGIKMALGARRGAIRFQFLTEALVLSVAGGLLGILVGVGLPLSARYFVSGLVVPISWASVAIAFLVSCLVGVVFGLMPAERASRLNPTEALRYE